MVWGMMFNFSIFQAYKQLMKLFFFLLNLIPFTLCAQPFSLELEGTEALVADKFWGVDTYNNVYFSENNVFYKIENEKTFQYQDLQLGDLESVDILNPLKVLLFYKEANTVVLLDNRFNEVKRINFNVIPDYKTVDFARISKDNLLWIFNADLQQLELFDYDKLTTQSTSLPLKQNVLGLKSNYNYAWVHHPLGFSIYTINASVADTIDLDKAEFFAVYKNRLMVLADDYFELYTKGFNTKLMFEKPKISFNQFYYNGENIYIYANDLMYTYRIQTDK
jgi:hypothetical protein